MHSGAVVIESSEDLVSIILMEFSTNYGNLVVDILLYKSMSKACPDYNCSQIVCQHATSYFCVDVKALTAVSELLEYETQAFQKYSLAIKKTNNKRFTSAQKEGRACFPDILKKIKYMMSSILERARNLSGSVQLSGYRDQHFKVFLCMK